MKPTISERIRYKRRTEYAIFAHFLTVHETIRNYLEDTFESAASILHGDPFTCSHSCCYGILHFTKKMSTIEGLQLRPSFNTLSITPLISFFEHICVSCGYLFPTSLYKICVVPQDFYSPCVVTNQEPPCVCFGWTGGYLMCVLSAQIEKGVFFGFWFLVFFGGMDWNLGWNVAAF